jgi:arginyl-tRNA--protein-N-Asp/Glu arginylyltransferase
VNNTPEQRQSLKLFLTAPHPCSYLPGMEAYTVFVDPEATIDQEIYTALSQRGYRRSGKFIYKPECLACQACLSLRIPVEQYHFSRNEMRIFRKNADLTMETVDNIFSDEYYALYANYIRLRHHDGDMYPPSEEQYQGFLQNAFGTTHYLAFRQGDQLKAVAVTDRLTNGLSSVYTFYDPNDEQRSLGTLGILSQLRLAQELSLSYLYLGYWVEGCKKMEYKSRFQPAEIHSERRWKPFPLQE